MLVHNPPSAPSLAVNSGQYDSPERLAKSCDIQLGCVDSDKY